VHPGSEEDSIRRRVGLIHDAPNIEPVRPICGTIRVESA
jgi:hypothetical protein